MRERQRTWLVMLTAIALLIVAASWLYLQGVGELARWNTGQDKLLKIAADQASASVAREIRRMSRTATLLVQQQAPKLAALRRNPNDASQVAEVSAQVSRVFDHVATFNLTDGSGKPLLPDPNGALGPKCRADLQQLALTAPAGTGTYIPAMHPSRVGTRFGRHFDLVVPEPGGGYFFIGLRADTLQQLLRLHRQPGQKLALVSGEGWRTEDLSADFVPTPTRASHTLTPDQRAAVRALVPVEGTRWALAASLEPGVVMQHRETVWRTQQRYWGAFTLVVALFSYLLIREIGRRSALARLNSTLRLEIGVRQHAEAKLFALTRNDPLTGLPNRTAAYEYLCQAIAARQADAGRAAVLFFDLDHFKTINDSLGHGYGDRVLCEVAQRLQALISEDELFARWGGDEFLLIQPRIRTIAEATAVASRLATAMRQSMTLDGHELRTTISVGIALYPECGTDAETLIRHADQALYRAKQNGRDGYAHFNTAMDVAAQRRLQRERELRGALECGEFELLFQPKLHLASGRAHGAEALLRWRHPVEGLLAPNEFLPLLEESGMICQVGDWVARRACEVLAAWQAAGLGDQRLAINLSAREFVQPGLIKSLARHLDATGVAPGLLELEITETCLMDHSDASLARLAALAARGFRLVIDDFGTGYSSLAYLRRFPVNALKIDQSFVRHMQDSVEDREIIRTIITLAHTLDLTVVAEGVEHVSQNEMLRSMGCDTAQGYLLARPLGFDEVTAWLRRHR